MKNFVLTTLLSAFCLNLFAQKQNLLLNLEKGKVYSQNCQVQMAIGQKIQGMEITIDMDITMATKSEIIKAENNNYTVKVRYEKMTMNVNAMGKEMSFGSDQEVTEENAVSSANKLLAALCGKDFTMVLSNKGKVLSVTGLDSLVSNMMSSLPNTQNANKGMINSQITEAFGEKAFIKNFEMGTDIFPENNVAVGDTWEKKGVVNSGGIDMIYKNKLTYTGGDSNGNNISIEGTMGTLPTEAFIEKNGMKLKMDMNGTVNSKLTIDALSGWTKECITTMDIKGKMSTQAKQNLQGEGMPSMEIPMTIKGTTTISTK
jgi:hypothetical protein